MRRDEHAAVRALMDAVTVAGVATGMEATVRAWLDVRGAVAALSPYMDAPSDEDARTVHGEPASYFLEIKGDPPDDPMDGEFDPDGWECPGCGYESESLDDALGMLRYAVGEGKPRRIVRWDRVYTVVREVSGDFPVD
jgi:hypothetical protein